MDGHYGRCSFKFGYFIVSTIHIEVNLSDPVEKLPYVGGVYAKRLHRLGIEKVGDLLYHFPYRYNDFRKKQKIQSLTANTESSIEGEIVETNIIKTKTGKTLIKSVIADGSGAIEAVWFNQPYLLQTLKKGLKVGLAGKVEPFSGRISLISPEFEILVGKRGPTHTAGLVPIYPETSNLSSKWIRSRIKSVLRKITPVKIEEFLPDNLLKRYRFPRIEEALSDIHFPKDLKDVKKSRDRFAFEELFLLNLRSLKSKKIWKQNKIPVKLSYAKHKEEVDSFIKELPFELTGDQKTALGEVLSDLEKDTPMNRLLEGDSGAGKTVVAAIAAYLAYLSGAKILFMAPTGVLADQHLETLQSLLEPKGLKIQIHTGTKKTGTGDNFDLLVGTHALFHKKEGFEGVGFVIIDEQHKFGVEQRAKLLKKVKGGQVPHLLTLTSTPIPRTLALTVYGDLDLSVLEELPPGRKRVKTFVVSERKRQSCYEWVKERINNKGDQVFVVCPLIEESDKETMQQVKAAKAEYERLKSVFKGIKVGLLHGKLKPKEKETVMKRFRKGKIKILVSTPVVEVGIDIPNATVMVVEAAERFGLASLHQLRGRVGRSDKESYCFLFSTGSDTQTLERLKALEKESSGFKLAELDMKFRGPGEMYGTRQHGLTELKVADLADSKMLKIAQDAAGEVAPKLGKHPLLSERVGKLSSRLVEPN